MKALITETVSDNLRLLPFLFLTYLILEWIEKHSQNKSLKKLRAGNVFGPIAGGVLGAIPQCGLSAASANLYTGGLVSRGTMVAVFLSTSDEMLAIFLSRDVSPLLIARIILFKAFCGIAAGLMIDYTERKLFRSPKRSIQELCEKEDCHCESGIFFPAIRHTAKIFFFLLLFSIAIEIMIEYVGMNALNRTLLNRPITGQMIAAIIGLIPNCAVSVMITTMYLEGLITTGALLSGLLASSGVGLLILFRMNHDTKDSLITLGTVYTFSFLFGIIAEIILPL